jgi:hypothetical protein
MRVLLSRNHSFVTKIRHSTISFYRFFLLFGAALVPSVSFGQSGLDSHAVEEARNAVVPIVCLVRARNDKQIVLYRPVGTGFLVDMTGTFITAAHVIGNFSDSAQKTACQGAIAFSIGRGKAREKGPWSSLPKSEWERPPKDLRWFPVDLTTCRQSAEFDVAVCKTLADLTTESVSHGVAVVTAERPPTDTGVFFIGFSLQATNPIVTAAHVKEFVVHNIYIDKSAYPGASGSPIFLLDGKHVVGMITKTGIENSAGASFGIAGAKIGTMLAEAKSQWEDQ